jgi:spore germination cell wall hydrolase CwlJ-like protein
MIKKRVFLAPMFLLLLLVAVIAGLVLLTDTEPYEPEVFRVEMETSIEIPKTELSKPPDVKQAKETLVGELVAISDREKTCLIRNVFFEAGSESHEGKIAVAQVTWNRLKDGRWGSDICRVVYAPGQFSWTSDLNKRTRKIGGPGWEPTIEAVEDFLNGTRVAKLENSMFFHASYVRPNWGSFAHRVRQIGNHIFYALK